MSYYAIGIGGTGAKCLEALIHLCAAGLMPDNKSLYLLFVDSDRSNGNGTRTGNLLKCYQDCRTNYVGGENLFKTGIPPLNQDEDRNGSNNWSPTEIGINLETFVSRNRLAEEFGYLFDILFSPNEAGTVLNEGFRGRPSIGSAVMAHAVNLDSAEPWKSLKSRMKADTGEGRSPKVMVFGSIFGGTGASGFPTISRLLHNWGEGFDKNPLQIGGTLLLPYFSFDGDKISDTELHVKSDDFVLNTQAALKYYHQQNFHEIMNATYLLGADEQREMPSVSIGGGGQENPPHWLELCAALAAIDFYSKDNSKTHTYKLLARQNPGNLEWSDLPHNSVKRDLLQLARFSFAYLSTYYPMLKDIETSGKKHKAAWYVNFFHYKNINISSRFEHELEHIKTYCEKFLLWFANIQFYVTGTEQGAKHLIDYSSFAYFNNNQLYLRDNFDLPGFEYILPSDMVRGKNNLDYLWENMSNEPPPSDSNQNAWAFINTLYRQSGK